MNANSGKLQCQRVYCLFLSQRYHDSSINTTVFLVPMMSLSVHVLSV